MYQLVSNYKEKDNIQYRKHIESRNDTSGGRENWRVSDFNLIHLRDNEKMQEKASKGVLQRAIAVNKNNIPFENEFVKIQSNEDQIKWVKAKNAQIGMDEKECKRKAINQCFQDGNILNPKGTEQGNTKWWLYGWRVEGKICVTGYVIRHVHDQISTGTIVESGTYYLDDGVNIGKSNNSVKKVDTKKIKKNNKEKLLENSNYYKEIDEKKSNVPHYHSANLRYLREKIADILPNGLEVANENLGYDATIRKAIGILSEKCHGETGHHVFQMEELF